ncbi:MULTISPECIES: hypothetical protein [Pseudomonas]|jgi:hypothetical protein|uniref:Uncharacterized protein n=1 Tax=Pseudomonas monsensis TaxID=2745509 RepID=A0ABT3Z171_9PSED|nr:MULTISPECIES: hypothetical protein [Pseudomonas]MCY0111519.1 hypothetical protein [Pseudomonas monsensis]MDZ3825526.1 hypothetical protein [Pseudomonas monsensis]
MSRLWPRFVFAALGAALLALVWWGWHQGGLALMQLGMSIC